MSSSFCPSESLAGFFYPNFVQSYFVQAWDAYAVGSRSLSLLKAKCFGSSLEFFRSDNHASSNFWGQGAAGLKFAPFSGSSMVDHLDHPHQRNPFRPMMDFPALTRPSFILSYFLLHPSPQLAGAQVESSSFFLLD